MSPAVRTHYDTLDIAPDADAGEIRRAWKVLVQAWHPDRFTGDMRDEAERRAAAINEAYHVLRDSGRRAAYDCRIASERERDDDTRRSASGTTPRRRATSTAHASQQRTTRSMPFSHAEPVSGPISPHAQSLGDVAADMVRELVQLVRRSPRFVGGSLVVMGTLLAIAFALSLTSGPSTLPSHSIVVRDVASQGGQQADADPLSQRQIDAAIADLDAAAAQRDAQARADAQAQAQAQAEAQAQAQAAMQTKQQPVLRVPRARTAGPTHGDRAGDGPRVLRIMPRG